MLFLLILSVLSRVIIIERTPGEVFNCGQYGLNGVMATSANKDALVNLLKTAGLPSASVSGWNGVQQDLVLRDTGNIAPYDPGTNPTSYAFCSTGKHGPKLLPRPTFPAKQYTPVLEPCIPICPPSPCVPICPPSPCVPICPPSPCVPSLPICPPYPCDPCLPSFPICPPGPCGPSFPICPPGPLSPCGPILPPYPCDPCLPSFPICPPGPCGPSFPICPPGPLSPCGPILPPYPCDPCLPSFPICPPGPCGPGISPYPCDPCGPSFLPYSESSICGPDLYRSRYGEYSPDGLYSKYKPWSFSDCIPSAPIKSFFNQSSGDSLCCPWEKGLHPSLPRYPCHQYYKRIKDVHVFPQPRPLFPTRSARKVVQTTCSEISRKFVLNRSDIWNRRSFSFKQVTTTCSTETVLFKKTPSIIGRRDDFRPPYPRILNNSAFIYLFFQYLKKYCRMVNPCVYTDINSNLYVRENGILYYGYLGPNLDICSIVTVPNVRFVPIVGNRLYELVQSGLFQITFEGENPYCI